MDYTPFAATKDEIKEIAAVKDLQDLWGADNSDEMKEILESIYTVRFDFMNESPGYVGDLFILQPSFLDSNVQAVRLIRNREKQLTVIG